MKCLWNQEATFFQLSIVLRLINNAVGKKKTENVVHALWASLYFPYICYKQYFLIYTKNKISLFLLYLSKLGNHDKM